MKQKFNVTGMTCSSHAIYDGAGALVSVTCAGGVNPPLRQDFAASGKTLVRATWRGAELVMPVEAHL